LYSSSPLESRFGCYFLAASIMDYESIYRSNNCVFLSLGYWKLDINYMLEYVCLFIQIFFGCKVWMLYRSLLTVHSFLIYMRVNIWSPRSFSNEIKVRWALHCKEGKIYLPYYRGNSTLSDCPQYIFEVVKVLELYPLYSIHNLFLMLIGLLFHYPNS